MIYLIHTMVVQWESSLQMRSITRIQKDFQPQPQVKGHGGKLGTTLTWQVWNTDWSSGVHWWDQYSQLSKVRIRMVWNYRFRLLDSWFAMIGILNSQFSRKISLNWPVLRSKSFNVQGLWFHLSFTVWILWYCWCFRNPKHLGYFWKYLLKKKG